MGKLTLLGLILALSVVPMVWLFPGRFSQEKREIREVLRQHPRITFRKVEVLSGKALESHYRSWSTPRKEQGVDGLVLEVTCKFDDLYDLIAFRRAIRNNPVLEKTFESPQVEFLNGGCHKYDPAALPDPPLEIRFILLPRPK